LVGHDDDRILKGLLAIGGKSRGCVFLKGMISL